jgi:hypothetical protein
MLFSGHMVTISKLHIKRKVIICFNEYKGHQINIKGVLRERGVKVQAGLKRLRTHPVVSSHGQLSDYYLLNEDSDLWS